MTTTVTQIAPQKENFLKALWKGDIPLSITYWVFGFLLGSIFKVVSYVIEHNLMTMILKIPEQSLEYLLFTYNAWLVVYSIFISVAIWRSATKYKGSTIWAILAKVLVVLGILALSLSLVFAYKLEKDPFSAANVNILNKSLPILIDEGARMEKVSLHEGNIYYNVTLLDIDGKEVDVKDFEASLRPELEEACDDKDEREFLEKGKTINFHCVDKNNQFFSMITVGKANCANRAPKIEEPAEEGN